jgi:hypothetical protein
MLSPTRTRKLLRIGNDRLRKCDYLNRGVEMGLKRAHIEAIRAKLKTMPPPPVEAVDTTKQEAVRLLAREIAALQNRGYSLEQIADSLRGEGLDLSTPTLKSYLARAKATRGRRKPAGTMAKVARGADAPVATGVAPRGKPDVVRTTAAEKAAKEALAGTTPKASTVPESDPAFRSGKDAFLIRDKDSY